VNRRKKERGAGTGQIAELQRKNWQQAFFCFLMGEGGEGKRKRGKREMNLKKKLTDAVLCKFAQKGGS